MAHQAFALSPIAARATLPSEEDYDAIREAFMETARGRWFLDEYAKRNRNADTRMVLDAVSRIEGTLAAQRQPPPPVVIDRLPEALALIRRSLEKAEGAASGAFDRLRLEENLAPIRKGARIIKEISWRWREIGADGRICDLIDSQVAAIETGCSQLTETDPRVALREAFESIRNEIEAFRHDAVASPPPAANVAPTPAPAPAPVRPLREVADAPVEVAAAPAPEPVEAHVVVPEVAVEPAHAEARPAELSPEEADAQDEAVLEMVALEMAAPEPDEPVAPVRETAHVTPPPDVEPLVMAQTPEPPAMVEDPEPPMAVEEPDEAPEPPAPKLMLQPEFQPSPPVAPEPATEPSLGSTLIASGILRKPSIPNNDPLAPIRRMSQAEKIAFFS
jgi:hypothetical protein